MRTVDTQETVLYFISVHIDVHLDAHAEPETRLTLDTPRRSLVTPLCVLVSRLRPRFMRDQEQIVHVAVAPSTTSSTLVVHRGPSSIALPPSTGSLIRNHPHPAISSSKRFGVA